MTNLERGTRIALTLLLFCSVLAGSGFEVANAASAASPSSLRHTTSDARVLFQLGWKRNNAGQKRQAIALYDEALEKDPAYFLAYLYRGKLWFDLGDSEQALKDVNKAIELYPKDWRGYG